MSPTRLTLSIAILVWLSDATAQIGRSSHWFFGYEAGLWFDAGQPFVDTTGNLVSIEGSSSISTTSGDLLFYSNGESVWNRAGDIMPNGTGVLGNQSSVQSSIIAPLPGSSSLYYLFTTGTAFRYSIVDMNLDGGFGDVTGSKNLLLHSQGTEELAGTLHCNGTEYWIIGRQSVLDTLRFYSYLLTETGLAAPVISEFPLPNPIWNTVGCLTLSQQGDLMVFSSFGSPIILFDFDQETGELSFRDSISSYLNENVYSNCLSPNAARLYVTSWMPGECWLSQFDLSVADISSSRVNIDSVDFSLGSPNGYGFIGQARLAPDQRIYVCRWNQSQPFLVNPNTYYSLDSLDVVQEPDLLGASCNFERNVLYLDHKPTQIGLPNFISSFTSTQEPTNGCSNGIHDPFLEQGLAVVPNPFTLHSTVTLDKPSPGMSLSIFDVHGALVRQINSLTGTTIDLERGNLLDGLYLLKLSRPGQAPLVARFSVE